MEPKKSQGPGPAQLAGSAILLCIVLVGVAFFLRDQRRQDSSEQGSLATSRLQRVVARCTEPPTEDVVDGRSRLRCASRGHPSFMLEVTGQGDEIDAAAMVVPMRGSINKLQERILLGLEMFGLVAGVQAEVFMPREELDAIGTRATSFVFEGRVYATKPVANVGLMFSVRPEGDDSEDET